MIVMWMALGCLLTVNIVAAATREGDGTALGAVNLLLTVVVIAAVSYETGAVA